MDSWVIVQTFINPQEAYMAKAFLESAGIETRMQDELTVRTGIHAQAIGGVKLLVRHECSPLFRPAWKCRSCGKAWKYK